MERPFSDPVHRKYRLSARDTDRIAMEMLSFLAEDGERLGSFLSTTGLDGHSLRAAVDLAGFAEGMVNYVSNDESLLIAFAQTHGYDPAAIEHLRMSLSPPASDF